MTEKRLYKLQLMLSDSELQEIDDFRFDVRAESRSAAVRDLIQQSLKQWKESEKKQSVGE
ncbi:hypothetical protein [Hyphococcus sp.]|uniref:hypothetical protein n=1 Tax=Hyphococcus sp. TaxID=2038636 RepID=UPI003CCBB1D2